MALARRSCFLKAAYGKPNAGATRRQPLVSPPFLGLVFRWPLLTRPRASWIQFLSRSTPSPPTDALFPHRSSLRLLLTPILNVSPPTPVLSRSPPTTPPALPPGVGSAAGTVAAGVSHAAARPGSACHLLGGS